MLVVNPFATSTTAHTRDSIVTLLGRHTELTVAQTTHSGHASDLAHQASHDGFDVVIGLGGDGTINEIANGILRHGPAPRGTAIAAIPGGHANVFVRNLGLPIDPTEATAHLITAFRNSQPTTIGIGMLSTPEIARWFLFNAGIGLDAAVLARMQERRASGKPAHDIAYAGIAVHELFSHNILGKPTLHITDQNNAESGASHFALIINIAPWTYLGDRPLDVAHKATLETALDVYAPRSLKPRSLGRLSRRIFTGHSGADPGDVIMLTNQDLVSFYADNDLWVQVDGEALHKATRISTAHVPDALRVWM